MSKAPVIHDRHREAARAALPECSRHCVDSYHPMGKHEPGCPQDLVEDVAEALSSVEREALERACRAVCVRCMDLTGESGRPAVRVYGEWIHQDPTESDEWYDCAATTIRSLMETKP